MTHNRKAIVSENGQYITVVVNGKEYKLNPEFFAGGIIWIAADLYGEERVGLSIWDAVKRHTKGEGES